jgi:hypothetical protein
MKRDKAMVSRGVETRQAKRAASLAQAAASVEQQKNRMREAETEGLMRTLARHVRRATAKPSA